MKEDKQRHSKNKEKNPLVDLMQMTWRYSKGSEGRVVLFLTLFLLAGTIDILLRPYVWSMIFDFIQTNGITQSSLPGLTKLMGVLIAVTLLFWALHGPARVIERTNAYQARINYLHFLVRGVFGLSVEWQSNHQTGETIDKVNKGGEALYSFSKDSFRILYEMINLIGSVSMLVWFFPSSGALMFAFMGICMLIVVKYDKKLIAQYKVVAKMQNAMSASIFDSLNNIMTVIILRVEKPVLDSIIHKAERPVDLNLKNNKMNETKWFLVSTCCTIMTVLVLGGYLYYQASISKQVSAGDIFLLYRYLDKVGAVFGNFAGMYSEVVQNRASVMNAEELSKDFTKEELTNHVLPKGWKEISMRNLNFSYNGTGSCQHLDEVGLDIRRGQRIAFVGKSGCGKSTLLKVIRGLHKPSSLALSVDGHPITDGFDGIARGISLVPQSPEIFNGSVLNNVTLGVEYDSVEVERCVAMARFAEIISALPNGYESLINERGVNLSGGQMQRLALARGLLASLDKSLILLDEPTSSLDGPTERSIYQSIFSEFKDAAIISAIHRLHLLPMFDTVCFFGDGRILATGSFSELMSSCQEFRSMYESYTASGQDKD